MTLQDDRPDAVKVARDARALIADRYRWTTGWYARTAAGKGCRPSDPLAVAWCATGAFLRDDSVSASARAAVAAALWRATEDLGLGFLGPATANDRGGHAVALNVYDRAIELLEREAAAA